MALNVETTSLVLDVYDHDHKQQTTIKAIALDSKTRYVTAIITNKGTYYSIDSTATVTLTVIRTDNTGVQITGTPYEHRVNTDGAEVTLYGVRAELSQAALAKKGMLLAQFKMTLGEQILRTEVFKINNGVALDAETSTWADQYEGYNLDELVQTVNDVVTTVTGMESDVSTLKEDFTDMVNSAYVTDSASGAMVRFTDGAGNIPMKSVSIDTESNTATVTRTGENLLNITVGVFTNNGITFDRRADGTIRVYGTATAQAIANIGNTETLAEGTYFIGGIPSGASSTTFFMTRNGSNVNIYGDREHTITEGSLSPRIYVRSGVTLNVVFKPVIAVEHNTYNVTLVDGVVQEEITTLQGENNVWSDAGDITCEYVADANIHADKDLDRDTKVIFLKSGSTNASGTIVYGNCTAIVGDKIGLIDLGMDSNCTAIISTLTSLGVDHIDFIVLSHYHIDHITKNITTAFDKLSAAFDLSNVTVYLPHKGIDWTRFGDVVENKSAVESQVIDYITNKGWTYIQPNNKDIVTMTNSLSIGFYNIGDYTDYYEYTMNESQLPHKIDDVTQINYNAFCMIVDVISHGKHIVIPADCPYIALDKCVNDIEGCDVYAVEHHGLERKASDDWLSRINPKVSIVFSYSQPTTDDEYTNIPTIMSLALYSPIFTTIDGDIVLTTSIDGMSITANVPTVNYRASALENGAHHDSVIDAFLSSYQSQAVNIQGSNTYVEMVGKYVEVNGIVYFSAINHYKKNVSSGSGSVSIASNLPAPYDESIRFVEKDCFGNFTPTRIYYNSVWRTIGAGESGTYKLVRGYYKTGVTA